MPLDGAGQKKFESALASAIEVHTGARTSRQYDYTVRVDWLIVDAEKQVVMIRAREPDYKEKGVALRVDTPFDTLAQMVAVMAARLKK